MRTAWLRTAEDIGLQVLSSSYLRIQKLPRLKAGMSTHLSDGRASSLRQSTAGVCVCVCEEEGNKTSICSN